MTTTKGGFAPPTVPAKVRRVLSGTAGATDGDRLDAVMWLLKNQLLNTYAPVLGLFFNLKGKPLSLRDHFPFEPIFNQELPLELTLITGRQTSKCRVLSDTELVSAANGRLLTPSELTIGTRLIGLGRDYRWRVNTVVGRHENPPSPVVRVTTRGGSQFTVTTDHRLRTVNGYKEAGELVPGDRLASLRSGGEFTGTSSVPDARVILTAYMLGDGYMGNRTMSFTSACPEIQEEFRRCAQPLQPTPIRQHQKKNNKAIALALTRQSQLLKWFDEDGLVGHKSRTKFIPAWVFDLDRRQTELFVTRLWATDGCVLSTPTGHPNITYVSISRRLCRDLRALMTKLGYATTVKPHKATLYGADHGTSYVLRVINRDSQDRFLGEMVVPGKPSPECRVTKQNNNRDTMPLEVRDWIHEVLDGVKRRKGSTLHATGLRLTAKYAMTPDRLREYLEYLRVAMPKHHRIQQMQDLLDSDVYWDAVDTVEPMGEQATFDVEVDGEHNYVLDGIVSHNSSSLAEFLVMAAAMSVPPITCLYVCPLYEQTRRFSSNYVRPLIIGSPMRSMWRRTAVEDSVLQRSFDGEGKIIFSFAGQDAERVRGVPADFLAYDERQGFDVSLVPVINSTTDASKNRFIIKAGTPLTKDNILSKDWINSSQAEWHIWCKACNHENVPSVEEDLERMIGEFHHDIGPGRRPGTVCAKCRRPIDPREGRWCHHRPEKRYTHPGYHVPQIILPDHYEYPDKWSILLNRRAGGENYSRSRFMNEILGVPWDMGSKPITQEDMERAASLVYVNRPEDFRLQVAQSRHKYVAMATGVDWGGGGADETSFTTVAVCGVKSDGSIDVVYGKRLLTPHRPDQESVEIAAIHRAFGCHFLAHDANGAGAKCEMYLVHMGGIPENAIIPMRYNNFSGSDLMRYHPEEDPGRGYWQLDKGRTLQMLCESVKMGFIQTFKFDYQNDQNPGLLYDFLSLCEVKRPTLRGNDSYTITRDVMKPDDFAQSVNMAACGLWQSTDTLAAVMSRLKRHVMERMTMPADDAADYAPANPWSDEGDKDFGYQP